MKTKFVIRSLHSDADCANVGLLQYMYEMLRWSKSNFVGGGGDCALALLGENQNMKVCLYR